MSFLQVLYNIITNSVNKLWQYMFMRGSIVAGRRGLYKNYQVKKWQLFENELGFK
jgi:hypothetical protein